MSTGASSLGPSGVLSLFSGASSSSSSGAVAVASGASGSGASGVVSVESVASSSGASGSVHVDNIAPSLFGGLVLTVGVDHPRTKQIPVPPGIRCVLVHPHMFLSTKEARGILSRTVQLSDLVWQCANLAGFISACYTNDLDMIRDAFEDVIIEPQRQALIPGFKDVKNAAMSNGALGCSISGAGPTVFCWCETPAAERIQAAMVAAFAAHGLACDSWISSIEATGARVLD